MKTTMHQLILHAAFPLSFNYGYWLHAHSTLGNGTKHKANFLHVCLLGFFKQSQVSQQNLEVV